MDGTTDRRHLTAARALVLDILTDAGPLTSEQIVTKWTARRPDMRARHRQQLDYVNLNWPRGVALIWPRALSPGQYPEVAAFARRERRL